jgi:hypothetical protein
MVVLIRLYPEKAVEQLMNRAQSERRQRVDRRRRLLSFAGLRRLCRRCIGRRRDGAENPYADSLSPRVIVLVFFVVLCSALDALFTLMYVQQGGDEANPIMAMALDQGMTSFVGAKMALTGLGAVLLAVHRHFWLGIRGLYVLALIYASLLVYHLILYAAGT